MKPDNWRLRLTTDSIGYEDISLLHSKIDLVGDMQRLDMKYTTDRLIYGNGYQLYNVRNELTLADNHLDNRLSWCNWGDKTYSGELSACVVSLPMKSMVITRKSGFIQESL